MSRLNQPLITRGKDINPAWLKRRVGPKRKILFRGTPVKLADGELWEFRTPPDYWSHHCGMAGIAVVRNGKIIEAYVKCFN